LASLQSKDIAGEDSYRQLLLLVMIHRPCINLTSTWCVCSSTGVAPAYKHRVIGNTFRDNRNAISLGGLRGNGATDNLIAESTIAGNDHGWWCNNALVGNHVLTSDTTDNNFLEGSKYCKGAQTDANVSFFAEPPL
jgi:hypothetical protein